MPREASQCVRVIVAAGRREQDEIAYRIGEGYPDEAPQPLRTALERSLPDVFRRHEPARLRHHQYGRKEDYEYSAMHCPYPAPRPVSQPSSKMKRTTNDKASCRKRTERDEDWPNEGLYLEHCVREVSLIESSIGVDARLDQRRTAGPTLPSARPESPPARPAPRRRRRRRPWSGGSS